MDNEKDNAVMTANGQGGNMNATQSGKAQNVMTVIPEEAKNDPDVMAFAEGMRQIRDGLLKPDSGTGTPISDLSGGAKENAQLSNIGGGSKASGGGGMARGRAIITETSFKNGVVMERYRVKDNAPKEIAD